MPLLKFQRRQWHTTAVLLPGKSHGRRSLVGCSPWGRWGSDTTEGLHFHFSLSCIGEGNGSPLHCSCLENPRDGGAWWAAVYGVAQSRTRLTWLSSSSNCTSHSLMTMDYLFGKKKRHFFIYFQIGMLKLSPSGSFFLNQILSILKDHNAIESRISVF